MSNDVSPATAFTGTALSIGAGVWSIWCNVIAFVGGKLPIPFIEIEIEGGILFGFIWLFFISPIAIMAAQWATILLMSPLLLLESARSSRD